MCKGWKVSHHQPEYSFFSSLYSVFSLCGLGELLLPKLALFMGTAILSRLRTEEWFPFLPVSFFYYYYYCYYYLRQGLLYSPDWPLTHYVAQAGLDLLILLPQPPAEFMGICHHVQILMGRKLFHRCLVAHWANQSLELHCWPIPIDDIDLSVGLASQKKD
jgi:hypothetical protein